MKITYWSDYACPYCYIGEERLKKALAELELSKDVEIQMKAFQLDPTAALHATSDTQTRFAHKYGISFEEAGRQIEMISALGRAEGLDFNYATTLFTNTMDAHRLTKLAMSKNNAARTQNVIDELFKAYFTENKELADREVLRNIGIQCGLDFQEVDELLASERFREEVLLDEREAARYGIHGVPFFIIGTYAISGAQSTEGMKAALRQAFLESEQKNISEGMSCGSEGCRIR